MRKAVFDIEPDVVFTDAWQGGQPEHDLSHLFAMTALRDITELLARGILRKSDAGGRSTSYELNDAP